MQVRDAYNLVLGRFQHQAFSSTDIYYVFSWRLVLVLLPGHGSWVLALQGCVVDLGLLARQMCVV